MKGFVGMGEMKMATTKYTKYTKVCVCLVGGAFRVLRVFRGLKSVQVLSALAACLGMFWAVNAATVTATTDAFRLSVKHDGIRQSAGDETLTYSSLWGWRRWRDGDNRAGRRGAGRRADRRM